MTLLERYYHWRKKEPPHYAKYSLLLLIWKPFRKFFNVVVIPNIPMNFLRIWGYRMLGYQIGKGVFIGMKCYLDDLNPTRTIIEDGVTISYGCYFSLHGTMQREHQRIILQRGVYVGMRCDFVATKADLIVGKNSVIGAASLVNKSIPENSVAIGVPAKVVKSLAQSKAIPKLTPGENPNS